MVYVDVPPAHPVAGIVHTQVNPTHTEKGQPLRSGKSFLLAQVSAEDNAQERLPVLAPAPELSTPVEVKPTEVIPELTNQTRPESTDNPDSDLPLLAPSAPQPADLAPSVPELPAPELPAPESPAPESPNLEPPDLESNNNPVQIDIETEDGLTVEEFSSQLRLTADFQEYNPDTQVITARGNVVLQLNDTIIKADEIWLNLVNRYTLATGNVLVNRGSQLVRGSRIEYNFIQRSGIVSNAVGTLFLPQLGEDFESPLDPLPPNSRRAYDPINRRYPEFQVSSEGSAQITTDDALRFTGANNAGNLQQFRFETDELMLDVEGWQAQSVRITNDPFSPPELELRTEKLRLRSISAEQDELLLTRPRLVFDQGLSLPLFRDRILFSRGMVDPDFLNPLPVSIGIDGRDRGGFYLGTNVPIVSNESTQFSVTPQFYAARALSSDSDSPIEPQNFGVTAKLNTQLAPRTNLSGSADLTSLDLSEITENIRTNLSLEQRIGNHRLALQHSYRERLFNGSLGFQDVQSSLGAVLLSPEIPLNDRGLQLTYQAGAQLINAETDRQDLLQEQGSDTGRITLGRYQASTALRQSFNLWQGKAKPATQDEGLRFTPEPLVPFLNLNTGLRATGTYYSSNDFQNNLSAEISLEGQLGHLARNFGDYTRFKVGYEQSFIRGDDSPFQFDREVDRNILSLGLTQQIYGPFLAGVQTRLSLNENRDISTIYTLEYSRRTYGVLLRYDASQNGGSIGFRLSNFSWMGEANPFDTPRTRRHESN